MDKKVAIIQSSYIPWKGYFDLINSVDEVILFDDMQYTKRDWRNRNRIKTPGGPIWLSIPVLVKGRYHQKIREVRVRDGDWAEQHWKTIERNYIRARSFQKYAATLKSLYEHCGQIEFLSEINYEFLITICDVLDIDTNMTWSMDYELVEGKTEKLVDLCQQAGADEYLSGPSARDYIDASLFAEADIALSYMSYSGYPEYDQLCPPFDHRVSVLDLILNEGPKANEYMISGR